jgi:hypothetical protein
MEQELVETGGDAAGKAFDKLRRELTTMRLAVEKLADEPAKIVIPDYTATLEKMVEQMQANAAQLGVLADKPGLRLTPNSLGDAIVKAGAAARADDHAALTTAIKTFNHSAQEMAGVARGALKAEEQEKWLWRAALAGAVMGAILCAMIPAIAVNIVPGSWHWPEKRAASVIGSDMWDAGERLQAVADPKRWEARSRIEAATIESKQSVAACLELVARTRKPMECGIVFGPEETDKKE